MNARKWSSACALAVALWTSVAAATPATDVVGGTTTTSTLAARVKGNIFRVDTTTGLLSTEFWLSFSDTQTLAFYVYESPTEAGTYVQVFASSSVVTGTGAAWYGSGPICYPLQAGRYYMIGVGWSGSTSYSFANSTQQAVPWGAQTHAYAVGTYPLASSLSISSADIAVYYQRLTTDAGDLVGGTSNNSTLAARVKGNLFRVDTSTGLVSTDFWLSFSDTQTLAFYVYESPAEAGTYTQVLTKSSVVTGTGAGWYGSGPIGYRLQAGKYYMIGVGWSGSMTYAFSNSNQSVPWGAQTHAYATGTYPPATSLTINSADVAVYYQRLTTDVAVFPVELQEFSAE